MAQTLPPIVFFLGWMARGSMFARGIYRGQSDVRPSSSSIVHRMHVMGRILDHVANDCTVTILTVRNDYLLAAYLRKN